MNFTIDHARLATRRERRSHDLPKAHRDRTWYADADGSRRAVAVPGPAALAAHVAAPGVMRDGRALVLDGEPLALADVVAALKAAVAALPELDDAEEPYRDLRIAAAYPDAKYAAYLGAAADEWVKLVPRVPKSTRTAPEDRAPAMTDAERALWYRARRRAEELASAEWAVRTFLAGDDDDPAPKVGDRIAGNDLYAFAAELLDYVVQDYEDAVEASTGSEDRLRAALFDARTAEADRQLAAKTGDEERSRQRHVDAESARRRADTEKTNVGALDYWLETREDEYAPGVPDRPRRVTRQALYTAAAGMGLKVSRDRRGVVLTLVRRLFRRLKEATMHALQYAADVLGDHRSPEQLDAEALEAIGAPVAPDPDPELEALAAALPGPVASAMASSDDPRRSLELVGAEWARRHPETREAIVVAHRAYGVGLVAHVRFRVASEVEAE
jgi:hypothetical protein